MVDCASVHTCYNIGGYANKTYNNKRRNLHNIFVNLHKYCGLIQAVSVCLYFVYASCDMWTLYINQILNNTVLFIPRPSLNYKYTTM